MTDEPSATETAAAPPRPVTEAPAKTDEVSVRLESAPTGARVLAGREALGVTPLTLELGPRQRRKVKLVLKGYRVQWVTVSAARRTLNVRLARLTAQGARGAKGAKGARAKRGARKVTEDSPLFNPYGD